MPYIWTKFFFLKYRKTNVRIVFTVDALIAFFTTSLRAYRKRSFRRESNLGLQATISKNIVILSYVCCSIKGSPFTVPTRRLPFTPILCSLCYAPLPSSTSVSDFLYMFSSIFQCNIFLQSFF